MMTTQVMFRRTSESESVIDADIDGRGDPVLLLFTGWARADIVGTGWRCPCPRGMNAYSIIRVLNGDRFLVTDTLGRHSPNAHVVSREGRIVASFDAGHGIQDVVVCDGRIVVSYSDEGIFGNHPLSWEGVAVFRYDGSLEFGYKAEFREEAIDILDCHALCATSDQVAWFHASPGFALVRLDLPARRQEVLPTPGPLCGSRAMSSTDDEFFFHWPCQAEASIMAWSRRDGSVAEVGEWKGRLRGILGGRFLGVNENEVVMLTP